MPNDWNGLMIDKRCEQSPLVGGMATQIEKKRESMEIDSSNNVALQEEEMKKLQAQNAHMKSQFQSELQQQVQILVQKEKEKLDIQYNNELKAAVSKTLLEQQNPYDFILVPNEESKKATDLNQKFETLLKQVEEFSVLASEEYGMQNSNDFLPGTTSDKGYIDIKKNISAKVTEHHRTWELVASKIKKLRVEYPEVQKLRHRRIKYKKKHSAATRKKNKKNEDKQVSLKAQYSYQDQGGDVDSDNEAPPVAREDLR